MDRCISIKEVFADRQAGAPRLLSVDTPKARLTELERDLIPLPWVSVHQGVNGNLLQQASERSLFVESRDRIHKKRTVCWRLMKLVKQLNQLELMRLKLGTAKRRGWAT